MTHRTTPFLIALACALPLALQAEELPSSKQTKLGLYLTAEETLAFLTDTPEALMIDVRTQEEIDESGLAEGTDALIPLFIPDPKKKDAAMLNPDFFPGIAELANSQQLAADHPIVIICRSGNRSAQAANALGQMGFTQVYTVTDGYLGDRAKSGPDKGKRTVNGWRNAGLPWEDRPANSCGPAKSGGTC
ncbi:MAG: rhodanese-like domain-containing protein [Dinoroseobacter sp.]|nr:rhodanese-like domain-containing protein [Dinoroseobacter sp.]